MTESTRPVRIDMLQYCNWSAEIFREMRQGGLDCVHVTVAYHEDFRETVRNLVDWRDRLTGHADLVRPALGADDIRAARAEGRTAILFGTQTPAPIEADIGLIEMLHRLGIRVMQPSYNQQSLLCGGHAEAEDSGLTAMGREAIDEMNRLGMIVDMSHSGERSTLEAIARSSRPVAVTHANPASWHPVSRNKSDRVLDALAESGGMLGFSLYPHHLAGGSDCTLEDFCAMVARTAERMGVERLGIGSDLCRGQPDSVVQWMRAGRWTRRAAPGATFPLQPSWFGSSKDFRRIAAGLQAAGFSAGETDGILGANWLAYLDDAVRPAVSS